MALGRSFAHWHSRKVCIVLRGVAVQWSNKHFKVEKILRTLRGSGKFVMSAPAILAKALFDNLADAPDELSFRKGDVITVLEQDVDGLIGWWLCSLHGKQGIAPGNRLQQIKQRFDGQSSPEAQLSKSSDVFTFEDIDYDVPKSQVAGGDYAVPRRVMSPDYDVPNASKPDSIEYPGEVYDLPDNSLLLGEINFQQFRNDNVVDHCNQTSEVYDVPSACVETKSPDEIYDIPSKDQSDLDCHVRNHKVDISTSPMSTVTSQEPLVRKTEGDNLPWLVTDQPDIYSEIYDVPITSGNEEVKRGSFESTPNLSLCVTPDLGQEKKYSPEVCKIRKHLSTLSTASHDSKRQSSSSTDSTKVSSEDDDYVDYQDIYGDGRQRDVSVYDVPVRPISLDPGQNFDGGPNSKRTQVSILQRINMSAVKELKLDPAGALQRLQKLEQAVNVTVGKLLSFVTTTWRNPDVLKPQLADIRDIAGKAKVALRLLTEFGLSSLVNARSLPSQELSGMLSRAIEPLLETYYSVKLALQRLDEQEWRVPLEKTNNSHDDLDLIMVHIRPVPENTLKLAHVIRTAATTLYPALRKSDSFHKSVETSEGVPQEKGEPSDEESGKMIKAAVKDAVEANFKSRSSGNKWSPSTVRRVCGMDSPKRNSSSHNNDPDETTVPTLPSRHETKSPSSREESKSPPDPPERKDSSEKCNHLRQKSLDRVPLEASGPPPKPKLDRKNTSRKSYKVPLFADHSREKSDTIRREHKRSESDTPTSRRKCNSDPTQLHDHDKKGEEQQNLSQSSEIPKKITLIKQSSVHISDSDLPQSLRQANNLQSSGLVHINLVDKELQHRPLSNFIKADGASNGIMVSLNDRELLEFYKYEIDAQLFVLSEAIKSFFAVIDKSESPKVFVSNSKFIVLSAHKFVYIGDTLSKRIKHCDLRSQVTDVTTKLSNCIKSLVEATKSAALQYPSSNALREMSDAAVLVNNVAVELYQVVKKTTKA